MALVAFNNHVGVVLTPFSLYPYPYATGSNTINAVGESLAVIGRLYFASGAGTSKTISAAGGKVWFPTGLSITWASAGSTIRVGVQDVNTGTGVEDGTYDVYDDLVQGTDTLTASTIKEVTLSSGTKTITHGDLVAIVIEMTVRNGTDSLTVLSSTLNSSFPYLTTDTGAGPAKTFGVATCAVQFDDGTIGHLGDWTLPVTESSVSFNNTTTPDEYATIFQVPFACTINGLLLRLSGFASGDDGTVHLIQDPLGAITNLQTATLTGVVQGATGATNGPTMIDIPETTLLANTEYAVSYRPTTAGARNIRLLTLVHANVRAALPILASGATRTDLGAFTQSLTTMPDFGIRINKIDTGSGSGGATAVAYLG